MLEISEKDAEALQSYNDSGIEQKQIKQKYPALQLNKYKNLDPDMQLFWCFAEESYALIPENLREVFKFEESEAWYNDEKPTKIYKIKADLRFIPLAIPGVFKENKNTKIVSKLSEFIPGDRTVAKLFLVPIVDGQLLVFEETLLIVTLKLRSFKTDEIIGRSDTDEGTLKKLTSELTKKGLGKGRSNVHFVNLEITPSTKVYKNKDGESSRGATYKLESAKLNSVEMMSLVSRLFTEELIASILDPFGLDNPDRQIRTGELDESASREAIKSNMKTLAKELGWGIPGIKRHLQEMFGVSESENLSIEQLTTALTSMENIAALPVKDDFDPDPF